MKTVVYKIILGVIRHTLTGIGGAMLADGSITQSQETAIIGGALALVGVIWSAIAKKAGVPDTVVE